MPPALTPVDSDEEDALRVSIEEVRVPVAAYDAAGRFDRALAAEDLLVREDGVAQQVKGVFRVPADVLLLLDTGGDANPAKSLRLTRAAAAGLVDELRPADRLALLQVNARVELLCDWTTDRRAVRHALANRLAPGRRSALAEVLAAALEHFRRTPDANRHLVIVSDGVAPRGREPERRVADDVDGHVRAGQPLEGGAQLRPEAPPGEYRRLDILTRRLGLTLRARRGYVVKALKPSIVNRKS